MNIYEVDYAGNGFNIRFRFKIYFHIKICTDCSNITPADIYVTLEKGVA